MLPLPFNRDYDIIKEVFIQISNVRFGRSKVTIMKKFRTFTIWPCPTLSEKYYVRGCVVGLKYQAAETRDDGDSCCNKLSGSRTRIWLDRVRAAFSRKTKENHEFV